MYTDIARFEPFAGLDRTELELVARHARRLALPGGRWLLRPGRTLRGHHFLLDGSVATLHPSGVISAGEAAAARAIHPGAGGLRTLCDCQPAAGARTGDRFPSGCRPEYRAHRRRAGGLLADPLSRLRAHGSAAAGCLAECSRPAQASRTAAARERVIRELDPDSRNCYVLADGVARVVRQGRCLAVLEPGELFGEDALITSEPRNASVVMETDGLIMSLDAEAFRHFLVELLLTGIYEPPAEASGRDARVLLRLGSSHDLRLRIARLNPAVCYLVSSGRLEVESLAIFLMRKSGIAAWAAPRD